MFRNSAFIIGLAISLNTIAHPLFIEKEYDTFKVFIDCRKHGVIAYEMTLGPDVGNTPRLHDFRLDSSIPTDCQMTTGDTCDTVEDGGLVVHALIDFAKTCHSILESLPESDADGDIRIINSNLHVRVCR